MYLSTPLAVIEKDRISGEFLKIEKIDAAEGESSLNVTSSSLVKGRDDRKESLPQMPPVKLIVDTLVIWPAIAFKNVLKFVDVSPLRLQDRKSDCMPVRFILAFLARIFKVNFFNPAGSTSSPGSSCELPICLPI